MAFCIVIAFRSLMTAASLISTVSNLMAGLSKIKEDEMLGAQLAATNNKQLVAGNRWFDFSHHVISHSAL